MTRFFSPHGMLSILAICAGAVLSANSSAEQLGGWVEHAQLVEKGITLRARLDSGARTCSLNASDLRIVERQGTEYAQFSITSREGKRVFFDEPVVRWSKIKRHFTESQRRPVIEVTICVGDTLKRTRVNLVDRANLNYQLLIGRNFLAGSTYIDSGHTYLLTPACNARE